VLRKGKAVPAPLVAPSADKRTLIIGYTYIISEGHAAKYRSYIPLVDYSCFQQDYDSSDERCYYGPLHVKTGVMVKQVFRSSR